MASVFSDSFSIGPRRNKNGKLLNGADSDDVANRDDGHFGNCGDEGGGAGVDK